MDHLIKAAWSAFWVGLGASAVLIAQSLFVPAPAALAPAPASYDVAPTASPAPALVPHHVLSRGSVDLTPVEKMRRPNAS
jgi:hypothetical protein